MREHASADEAFGVNSPIQHEKPFEVEDYEDDLQSDVHIISDFWDHLKDSLVRLLLWHDTWRSFSMFLCCFLFLLLAATEFGGMSVLTLSCHLMLLHLVSSVAYVKGVEFWTVWTDPSLDVLRSNEHVEISPEDIREYVEVVVGAINALLPFMYDLYTGRDLFQSLKFAITLLFLAMLGQVLSGFTIMLCVLVALFTLPRVYLSHKAFFNGIMNRIGKILWNLFRPRPSRLKEE